MSKNVISQSADLVKLKKKYKRRNILESLLLALLILVLFGVYIFLAAVTQGRYMDFVFSFSLGFDFFKYYPLDTLIFDLSIKTNIFRLSILLGVIALSILVGVAYYFLHYNRLNKKFKSIYLKDLIAEAKINGIVIDYNKELVPNDPYAQRLELMNIPLTHRETSYQFSTPMLSWEGVQYTYGEDKRDGFLVSTDLSKARTQGLIQLRTIGAPSIKQYQGLDISKYGFGEDNRISDFICFTSLGNDIYLAINTKVADALSELRNFLKSELVVMVTGEKLSIFIDGFRLSLTNGLDAKLSNDLLERQAEALVALHQVITALSMALSGEITFGPEGKGNGISDY